MVIWLAGELRRSRLDGARRRVLNDDGITALSGNQLRGLGKQELGKI